MNDIGERFILVRRALDMTQREMADYLGVANGTIQGYEYGKWPKADILKRLSECGFDANWILTGEGEMLRDDKVSDTKLIWNVAFFLCERSKLPFTPHTFADTFVDIYEWMAQNNEKPKGSQRPPAVTADIIDFAVKRLSAK